MSWVLRDRQNKNKQHYDRLHLKKKKATAYAFVTAME